MAEALLHSLPAPGSRDVDLETGVIVEVLDLLGGDLRESDVVIPLHVPGDLDEMIFDAGVCVKVCTKTIVRGREVQRRQNLNKQTEVHQTKKWKLILWTRTPRVFVLFR
eukprot:1131298-Rhodomonas_salina.1